MFHRYKLFPLDVHSVQKDLNLEGIATLHINGTYPPLCVQVQKDLNLEGIATFNLLPNLQRFISVQKDLNLEGIATIMWSTSFLRL